MIEKRRKLDNYVENNFKIISFKSFFAPLFLLVAISAFLYANNGFCIDNYIQIQKELFFSLNIILSQFPKVQLNITQLGDVMIFLPFISILIIYCPKFWQSLLTSLILSAIFSNFLKKMFAVPRPAAIFDNSSFVIIGEKLSGYTSLPSGHSIATFTILTLFILAFTPKNTSFKIYWRLFILVFGLIIVSSRIAVGAHYPLDVIIGCCIGSISSIFGVLLTRKYNTWSYISNTKYNQIFILLLSIWAIFLIIKIVKLNLIIFYISLSFLILTIYFLIYDKQ